MPTGSHQYSLWASPVEGVGGGSVMQPSRYQREAGRRGRVGGEELLTV